MSYRISHKVRTISEGRRQQLSSRKDAGEPSNRKKPMGDREVRAILESDTSVMSVTVLDMKGGVSSVARSGRLPKGEQADQQTIQQLGTIGTIIIGAAERAEGLFGASEFILGTFKNGKILLIKMPDYESALAVRLSRSANTEHVFAKITGILARD